MTRMGRPADPPSVEDYPIRAVEDGWRLVSPALGRATRLVSIVRDEDAAAVAHVLDRCDHQALYALCVVLAAMVPDDVPRDDLLEWVTKPHALLRVV